MNDQARTGGDRSPCAGSAWRQHTGRGAVCALLSLWAATQAGAASLDWPLKNKDQKSTPFSNLYGQYNDFSGQQYTHPGVDLKADKDTQVVAGVAGKVSALHPNGGNDGVLVKTDPANAWAWAYWHQTLKGGLSVGDNTNANTQLGKIWDNTADWNHLHLGYVDAANPFDTGRQNPLRHLEYKDALKPTIEKDGFKTYPNQTNDVYFETVIPGTNLGQPGKDQVLVGERAPLAGALPGGKDKSEVDVAVSAYDQVDDSPYRLGLYRMGYWIDAFPYLPDSASVDPHVTFRFHDTAPNQTNGAKDLIYKDDAKADSAGDWTAGETNGKGSFWHIVTNTTDTSSEGDPNSVKLSADAAWKTKNGAALNARARSPDGEYNIVAYAHDLELNAASDFSRVRVDNFEQLAAVRSTSTDEFMESPSYRLPAETAAVDPDFVNVGDAVFTRALDMLANDVITAYLLPHRSRWTEGESLLHHVLASVILPSNGDGMTPWGLIWTANRHGVFDIIFDYDHDSVFSYTLDPLIGFRVIPAPAPLSLLAGGLGLLLWGRRGAAGPHGGPAA